VGAVNARYGRQASALFYTHLTARQAPFHTVAIPPAGEAAHVIDGLLFHEAGLSIAMHHTDEGGVSDHVFALMYLLGYLFRGLAESSLGESSLGVTPKLGESDLQQKA
jgi:TnpA family transposase